MVAKPARQPKNDSEKLFIRRSTKAQARRNGMLKNRPLKVLARLGCPVLQVSREHLDPQEIPTTGARQSSVSFLAEEDFATRPDSQLWDNLWKGRDDDDSDSRCGSEEGRLAFDHFIQHVFEEYKTPDEVYGIPCPARPRRSPVLESFDLAGVVKYIQQRPGCKTLVLTGAGISVAAGIPDFRTPGTGLYSRLEEYNLPMPSAIFDLDYFPNRPEAFYTLAKELWPGNYAPTLVHTFIKLLHDKGLLLRSYTQNIDGLDLVAGLSPDALVEVHGTFATARCLSCQRPHPSSQLKEAVFADRIPRCSCGGLIKPDIVFFGEQLPERFFEMVKRDFDEAELVIVIGTSLQVAPFSSLPDRCDENVPRLLINNEVVGEVGPFHPFGFDFSDQNYRDVKVIGDCQQGILELAALLGWKHQLVERYNLSKVLHAQTSLVPDQFSKPTWLVKEQETLRKVPCLSGFPDLI